MRFRVLFILSLFSLLLLLSSFGIFLFLEGKPTLKEAKIIDEMKEENMAQEPVEVAKIQEKQEEVLSEKQLSKEELILKTKEIILEAEILIAKIEEFLEEQQRKEVIKEEVGLDMVKGLYMTGFVAAGQGSIAEAKRDKILHLLSKTELNTLVIDVKEAEGPYVPETLKRFIEGLNQKGIWTIACIVAFADASLVGEKPEFYLKSLSTGDFWQDWGKRYWLDPASPEAQDYIIQFSKKIVDLGFDELQYDYIRFPTDGNLKDIVYPAYDGMQSKTEVINAFSGKLSSELREYKPGIVLSIDLFGLVATKYELEEIGQSIEGSAKFFDYLSFMLYPSHFYSGFEVSADQERSLPYLYFPYVSQTIADVVVSHPYEVVYRSILSAADYLNSLAKKGSDPSFAGGAKRIRPWLQDFSLKFDTDRGIVYDAQKVRLQIKAAEDAGASGWLLWNPKNEYTENVHTE